MVNQLTRFEELKRKLYLWTLPILIIALISSLFFWRYEDNLNKISLPLLVIGFSVSWIFIFIRKHFRYIELFNVIIISVLHLLKSYEIVYIRLLIEEQQNTGNATFWTPLVYVFIFITLKGKTGIIYSLLLWSTTLTIGLSSWTEITFYGIDALIQYHLSNLVYIVFLFFSRHIISSYAESELLQKIAFQDSLTEIGNRRMVYKWLESNINKERHFSVIFFDLDHFKHINDKFGHATGDMVLKRVTSLIKTNIDTEASFGRWGGEEFIIILQNQTVEEAMEIAEELRRLIEKQHFPNIEHVTSSFGVDMYQQGDTIETLMDRVDEALYLAKKTGRNSVKSLTGTCAKEI